jgi:hypothetical protein
MTIECLDDDFGNSQLKLFTSDQNTPQLSATAIDAVLGYAHHERTRWDNMISLLEEMRAKADTSGEANLDGARGQPVAAETGPAKVLSPGTKRQRVCAIVAELTKEKESVRTPEIMAEMERLGLFKNVTGNKREHTASLLHLLKQSGHLDARNGNWFLASNSASTELQPATSRPDRSLSETKHPRKRGARPDSKRGRCARILKSLCENETQSARRPEIQQAWHEAGVFDDVLDEGSATSAMLTHLKNYGYVTTDNRGTWTWIGLS